jgi:glycerol-3-phosphate dehydrogenase
MKTHTVIVIGGGSTGSAVAHDLALRGLSVTLVERGEIASATTGRNHCLLHSGGRYCVKDSEAGIECIEENMILRKIMPHALELNGGLFVALDDSDMDYKPLFIGGCEACGIPYEELTGDQARAIEPYLSPNVIAAVRVPDGVFEPMRLCYAFLATAKKNGAKVITYTQVEELIIEGKRVVGIKVWDRRTDKRYELRADMIVNATGPWAGDIAAMAGIDVPVIPTPGVMVSMEGRFCNLVINRLNKAADGDIVLPQRRTSIIGTTSWTTETPDYIPIPDDHIQRMYERGAEMLPALSKTGPRGIFAVARPLIGSKEAVASGRELSRTFECFNHASEGVEGFVTISGGKTTSARAMAEKTADVVCQVLGIDVPCRTRETPLLSYRAYYTL